MSDDSHPIPLEQQPLHQYQELNRSRFFSWPALPAWDFYRGLFGLWVGSWLLSGPLAAASFAPGQDPGRFLLAGVLGANGVALLVMLRLYLGWSYLHQRLDSAAIVYEESGWYDGSTYEKSEEEVTQHRLIDRYEVTPILTRLHQALIGLLLSSGLAGLICWRLS